MGLSLRLNLYYRVSHEDVYDAYAHFYQGRGAAFKHRGPRWAESRLHEREGDWTVVTSRLGWQWDVTREAQLHMSRELDCPGFLIFVFDGDYWGYEFFDQGRALDHFIQELDPWEAGHWFPGESWLGQADVLAEHLPFLDRDVVQRYLVHYPQWDEEASREVAIARHRELMEARNVKARPEDEYLPFAECGVLSFLRYLGVRVEVRDDIVTFLAPLWRELAMTAYEP